VSALPQQSLHLKLGAAGPGAPSSAIRWGLAGRCCPVVCLAFTPRGLDGRNSFALGVSCCPLVVVAVYRQSWVPIGSITKRPGRPEQFCFLCVLLSISRRGRLSAVAGAPWFHCVSLALPTSRHLAFLGRSVFPWAWPVVFACLPCARATALGHARWLFCRFGPFLLSLALMLLSRTPHKGDSTSAVVKWAGSTNLPCEYVHVVSEPHIMSPLNDEEPVQMAYSRSLCTGGSQRPAVTALAPEVPFPESHLLDCFTALHSPAAPNQSRRVCATASARQFPASVASCTRKKDSCSKQGNA
jgi:hypothetical protein